MRAQDILEVDWMEGLGNSPNFRIATDCPESDSSLPWERRGDGLHRRDQRHTVNYFYTTGQPCQGYGGSWFEGELTTGESFRYRGAWSSRADCVNELWPEEPIIEVHWGMMGTAVKVADILDWYWSDVSGALAARQDFGLALIGRDRDNTPRLAPTRNGKLKAGDRSVIIMHSTPTNKIELLSKFYDAARMPE